jgi:hypothetical protein
MFNLTFNDEFHNLKCCDTEWHFAEWHFAECRFIECNTADYCYAEGYSSRRHYVECFWLMYLF